MKMQFLITVMVTAEGHFFRCSHFVSFELAYANVLWGFWVFFPPLFTAADLKQRQLAGSGCLSDWMPRLHCVALHLILFFTDFILS